jgi:hypothetical protein
MLVRSVCLFSLSLSLSLSQSCSQNKLLTTLSTEHPILSLLTHCIRMGRSHSRSPTPFIDINAWNARNKRNAHPFSRLTSWFKRAECTSHYVQYNCPHHSPILRMNVQGCRKCVHHEGGKCEPVLLQVLSPRWCVECDEDIVRSRLERVAEV